ncbi:hypothetical protein [Nitrospira moscoviensis]|uniref:Uncharacterized protein n=1 Tax=Nitrospira moscoviensis TaxID=42253 RepID=A0A0K2GEA9_NITMO|nr:hypothetical protein [Nitrospira moscoviensis]ALA59288.1 exported protein of unknown function [Nitrospira moscoviensis]
MNKKSAIPVVLLCVCLAEASPAQTSSPTVKPATAAKETAAVRNAVHAWLECIECRDEELKSVVALGDAAVPHLVAALLLGPSPASREVMRQNLFESFQSLQQYAASHTSFQFKSTQIEYIKHYMDNYIALYRTRASVALAEIGGVEAEEALHAVAGFFRPDVEREIKRSVDTIQRKAVP